MRRFLVTILVVGAFLGGYQLGRQPGSPDVIGWAQETDPAVAEAGRSVAACLTADSTQLATPRTPPADR